MNKWNFFKLIYDSFFYFCIEKSKLNIFVNTGEISGLVPAILILSILCSSNGFQQTHAQFKYTRLCQQGANAVRRRRRIRRILCQAVWLQAHAQFNLYISFLCSAIYYIALLLTVAEKRFSRRWHKKYLKLNYR